MEIKEGILNNLLCMACLCIGRCIQEVKDERLRQYYLDLLMEIPLNNTKLPSPLLCWECEALLQKVVTFREQVKDSYRILQTYTNENFNECLQSDVSRPPRLKVIQQKCINIPPEDTVKVEINEDKPSHKSSRSDVSDAEPEELHTVICDVERHTRRKNFNNDRKCPSLKLEERDPVCIQDEVKVELQDDILVPMDNMKIESFDIKTDSTPRERRKKVHQNNTNTLETIESNKHNGNDMKIEDIYESKDCKSKSLKSHSDEDTDDRIQVLEDVKKKTSKETKYTKNQYYITLQLSYEDMQAERQALRKTESFVASKHKCESCVITFNNENSLKIHNEKRHLVSGKYICSVCDTNMTTVEEFSDHYKRHMKTYECSICNKRIAILKDIQQHLSTEHDIYVKKYTCDVCGVVSNSSATHRYHKDKYHSNKPRIQCTDCDKTFSHRAGLMNHRLTFHEYQNKFPCTVCSKVFRWKTSLKRHLKKHNESVECRGSWFCAECGVSFSSSCSLQRHLRSSLKHVTSDQRRFICDHCGHRFTDKTKLRDHIEEKHLYRTYHCHICNKPSKNRVGLEQHIRTVHKGRPNNRMCHHCGKGFPTKVQLESHIRTHTGERPFMCEYCPTTFSQQSNLYKHHRQVHLNIKSKRYPMCKKRRDATQTDMAVFPLPVVHFMPENGFGI